jgi:hypothetical protein
MFHIQDLFHWGDEVINSRQVSSIFSNPFFSAALITVVIMLMCYVIFVDASSMELARMTIFCYIAILSMIFINNTLLLRQVTSIAPGQFSGRFMPKEIMGSGKSDDDDEVDDEPAPNYVPPLVINMPAAPEEPLPPINWLSK